jgi:hypothetical protein
VLLIYHYNHNHMLIKSSCETTTQIYLVVLDMQHVLRPLAVLDKIYWIYAGVPMASSGMNST